MWFKIVVKILKLLAFFLKGKLHIVLYTLILHDLFMARFEQSRERKGRRDSRDGSSRRGRGRFRDGPRRRDSSRGSYGRNKREVEMTKVTCSSCGEKCEVPFKPTSTKPVYCNECFSKEDKGRSNKDFEMINEKLDKIMKALKIE